MIFSGLHHLGHQEHREDSGLSHPAQQQILHMQKDGLLEVFFLETISVKLFLASGRWWKYT